MVKKNLLKYIIYSEISKLCNFCERLYAEAVVHRNGFLKKPALNFFENDRKIWTINRSAVFFVNVE